MPLFEYECRDCRSRFELLVYDSNTQAICRECGSADLTQLLSTFAVSSGSGKSSAELGPCGACGAAQRGMCGVD